MTTERRSSRAAGVWLFLGPIVLTAVAGCGGPETSDVFGSTESAVCASDSDCKGDRICDGGACVDPDSEPAPSRPPSGPPVDPPPDQEDPPSCVDAGNDCDPEACCGGSTCIDMSSYGVYCALDCTADSQCSSGCCAGVIGGGSICAPAEYCSANLEVGETCTTDAQCKTGICFGWCSAYCPNSDACPVDSWCVEDSAGAPACFNDCLDDFDCAAIPGTYCLLISTVEGWTESVCSY